MNLRPWWPWSEPAPAWPARETGAVALREAARRQSTCVIVPDDPLADVAAEWRAMWEPGAPHGPSGFEGQAAEALAAWRGNQFELPDYCLVVVGAGAAGPDLYLGPLRAARPHPARPGLRPRSRPEARGGSGG